MVEASACAVCSSAYYAAYLHCSSRFCLHTSRYNSKLYKVLCVAVSLIFLCKCCERCTAAKQLQSQRASSFVQHNAIGSYTQQQYVCVNTVVATLMCTKFSMHTRMHALTVRNCCVDCIGANCPAHARCGSTL
jgi:hypothetical protein